MAKISITLQEGPNHGLEVKIDGPAKTDQHFVYEDHLYRVINNGQYAQSCGPYRKLVAMPKAKTAKGKSKSKSGESTE